MNTIPPSHKGDPPINMASEEIQISIYPQQHEYNITEGSEFLDDAIRMKDQPISQNLLEGNE